MLEIEAQRIASHKQLALKSSACYETTARTEWSKMWPGQIVLASSQIFWTTEVEAAIRDGELELYIQKQQQQIEDIVLMVRLPLKEQERITLKALVVIDVHARDVVQRLIDLQISNIADFEWSSQLRYYWEEKDTLMVKMVTAEIPYAYEYLGNSARLVITPLTDRCVMTLTTALTFKLGGAPAGPAGTGKTETVKDMGRALGIYVIVTNCTDQATYVYSFFSCFTLFLLTPINSASLPKPLGS
jgi:dynein heavy chain